jgi:hypothetical protein
VALSLKIELGGVTGEMGASKYLSTILSNGCLSKLYLPTRKIQFTFLMNYQSLLISPIQLLLGKNLRNCI